MPVTNYVISATSVKIQGWMTDHTFSYLIQLLLHYFLYCEVLHECNYPVIAELPVQNV
jgi:hypothetical protein